jgi:hypothetical protein
MSVAYIASPEPASERRRSKRVVPNGPSQVRVGRGTGTVVNVSEGGARLRHSGAVAISAEVNLACQVDGYQFTALARVLSSRVISFGDSAGSPTMYETRVVFVQLSGEAMTTLAQLTSRRNLALV